jgi:hypothetical protein
MQQTDAAHRLIQPLNLLHTCQAEADTLRTPWLIFFISAGFVYTLWHDTTSLYSVFINNQYHIGPSGTQSTKHTLLSATGQHLHIQPHVYEQGAVRL